MKKLTLLFSLLLLTVSMAFSQAVIYSQTFGAGIPAGWTNGGIDKNGTAHTGMWHFTSTGNNDPGGWPTVALQSPTASNGWIIFDSDSLDNSGTCPAPQRGYLTTAPVSCVGHARVLLQFYDLYFCYDGYPRVIVSNGLVADTIDIHPNYTFTFGMSPNGGLQQFDVSSVAANQSNVTVTFLWDQSAYGYYYWQVDDISLIDAPANDLQIAESSLGFPAAGSFLYYQYPFTEVDSISYYAYAVGVGHDNQPDSRVRLQITEGGVPVFTDTSRLGVTLTPGVDSELIGVRTFLPTSIGVYNSIVSVFSDSADGMPYNNIYSDTFAVTDSTIAVDNNQYGGSFITYCPAALSSTGIAFLQEWANIFYLPKADTVTSITASFDAASSAQSVTVRGNVYSLPANFTGYGAPYTVTPVISTAPTVVSQALGQMTIPNVIGPVTIETVTMPISNATGATHAAILQPGFYAVSITNVNDSLVSLVNGFAGTGAYGSPGGEIVSGQLTAYTNTHFILRMNLSNNFNLSNCPVITVAAHQIGTTTTASATPSGGVGPYTYSWSTTPVQTTGTATGLTVDSSYTVTVTDSNGCTGIGYVTIAPAGCTAITVTASQIGATSSADVSSIVGGAAPYTYHWSTSPQQTTDTAYGLTSGTYSVTVQDHNGCTGSATVTMLPATCSIIPAATQVPNSSSAFVTGNGAAPYTYAWSTVPVQNTDTATGLTSGSSYHVTVTDHNGCSGVATVTIGTCAITATATQLPNSLSAYATATGGTGPYTYHWNTTPPGYSDTATGLTAGSAYRVTVTDHYGCTGLATITVAACTISVTALQIGSSPDAYATATSGTAPFTYRWSNSETTDTATALSVGNYTVTVTDHNGCTGSANVAVTTGINAIGDISGFNIYPNPSNGIFTVSVHLISEADVTMTINDVTGQKLYESLEIGAKDLNKPINLNNLAAGVYFVNIKTALGSANRRIVIK